MADLRAFADSMRATQFWQLAYADEADYDTLVILANKNRKLMPAMQHMTAAVSGAVSPAHKIVTGLAYKHAQECYTLQRMCLELADKESLDCVTMAAKAVANNYMATYLWEYAIVIECNPSRNLLWPVYDLLTVPAGGAGRALKVRAANAPSFDPQEFV